VYDRQVKRRELERKLIQAGWYLLRHGGNHDIWTDGNREEPVPRHAEINDYLGSEDPGEGGHAMRLEGRVWKSGRQWLIEVPMLDLVTQGRSRKDALSQLADAIESLVDQPGFSVAVFHPGGDRIEVAASSSTILVALLLRRQREAQGLSLAEVSKRLGQTSRNAYARYEQGKAVPTLDKLQRLLSVVGGGDFVLRPS